MYTEDIRILLNSCSEEVSALRAQALAGALNPVHVKNFLENLRSALDYSASDLATRMAQITSSTVNSKVYFPYGARENHFKKSVARNLPQLQTIFPKVFIVLESAQRFKSHDGWLVDLCDLTNEVKHNNLAKTEELKWPTIRQPGGVHVSGPGAIMRGNYGPDGPLDDVMPDAEGNVCVSGNGQTWVTVENKIIFRGQSIEVVPFLEKCTSKLIQLTTDIGSALGTS